MRIVIEFFKKMLKMISDMRDMCLIAYDKFLKLSLIKNRIFDIFLGFITLFFLYVFSQLNIFISMMWMDGIFSALDFFNHCLNTDLTASQALQTNSKIYNVGLIERYAYYIVITLVDFFLKVFVFNNQLTYLKYFIVITMIPTFFNNVTHKYLLLFFQKITFEKNDIMKKIYVEQTANVIVQLEKIYISEQIMIEKKEIMIALEDLTKIKAELPSFIKNTMITMLLIYLRKSSRPYYKTAKWLYVYMVGDYIKDISIDEAKELFKNVIENKKYDYITKPMFIQAMIYLYWEKENTGELNIFMKKINFKIVAAIAFWTLGSFFTGFLTTIIILICSFGLIYAKKYPLEKNIILTKIMNNTSYKIFSYVDDSTIISTLSTIIVGLLTNNSLFISFINQFAGILLINNITFNLTSIIYKNTHHKLLGFWNDMHHNTNVLSKYLLIVLSYIIFSNITHTVAYVLPLITNFMDDSKFFKYLYPILFIGSLNCRINYAKLIVLGYVLSLIDNILTIKLKSTHVIVNSQEINDNYFGTTQKITITSPQLSYTNVPVIKNISPISTLAEPYTIAHIKSPPVISSRTIQHIKPPQSILDNINLKESIEIDYLNPTSEFLRRSRVKQ